MPVVFSILSPLVPPVRSALADSGPSTDALPTLTDGSTTTTAEEDGGKDKNKAGTV